MQIDRKEFLEELKQEQVLRENVRKAIRIVKDRKGRRLQEELKLRTIIRKLINEQEDEKIGKYSTGINELEALLKKIVPQLEDDYKILTTDPDQRQSFRAHILHAVKNTIGTIAPDGVPGGGGEGGFEGLAEELTLKESVLLNMLAEEIEVEVDDDVVDEAPPEGFIDIDPEEPAEVEEEDTFAMAGMDATGAKIAERSWTKVEKSIKDSFSILDNDKDKKEFYDYLITNLKLYFDKFEDEMAANLEEPTTPEYEQEKKDQEALGAEEGEEELGGEEEFGAEEEEEFPEEEGGFEEEPAEEEDLGL